MTAPKELVPVPSLVAELCARLAAGDRPLSGAGQAAAIAADLVTRLRAGADETELRDRFDELDAALKQAGLPDGLIPADIRADADPPRYGALPGLRARTVHAVLRCPAHTGQCDRAERATWATRAAPPPCAVHALPLREERVTG